MSVLTTGVPQRDIAMKTHYNRRCHFHKDLSAEFTKRQANSSVIMMSEAAGGDISRGQIFDLSTLRIRTMSKRT